MGSSLIKSRLFFCGILLSTLLAPWSSFAVDPPGAGIRYSDLSAESEFLRVHFIDIGPGDAILIETPASDGKHIFIDGGKWGLNDILIPYLQHFIDDNPIDLGIISHPDFDHLKGMHKAFAAFDILEYWDTGYDSPELGSTWRDLQTSTTQELSSDGVPCNIISPISGHWAPGEFLDVDNAVTFQFINVDGDPPHYDPDNNKKYSESQRRNDASLVLKLVYGETSFLLTGDINGREEEHEGEDHDEECGAIEKFLVELDQREDFITSDFLQATVLKAPHHGSNGSSSLPFIREVDPEWVVFCAGHQFDHPHPDTIRRYHEVFGLESGRLLRTDEGDSTPEVSGEKDDRGDDSFVFEVSLEGIEAIHRLRIE